MKPKFTLVAIRHRLLLAFILTCIFHVPPLTAQKQISLPEMVKEVKLILGTYVYDPEVKAKIQQMLDSKNEATQRQAIERIKTMMNLTAALSLSAVQYDRIQRVWEKVLGQETFREEDAREEAGLAILETIVGVTPARRRIIGAYTAMDVAKQVLSASANFQVLGLDIAQPPARDALVRIARERIADPDEANLVVEEVSHKILDEQGFMKANGNESLRARLDRIADVQLRGGTGRESNDRNTPQSEQARNNDQRSGAGKESNDVASGQMRNPVPNDRTGMGNQGKTNPRSSESSRSRESSGALSGGQNRGQNQVTDSSGGGSTSTGASRGNNSTVKSPSNDIQVGRAEDANFVAIAQGTYESPEGSADPNHGKHGVAYVDEATGRVYCVLDDGTQVEIGYIETEEGRTTVNQNSGGSDANGPSNEGNDSSASSNGKNGEGNNNGEGGKNGGDDDDNDDNNGDKTDNTTTDEQTSEDTSNKEEGDTKEAEKGTPNPEGRARSGKTLTEATQGRMGQQDARSQQRAIDQRRGRGASQPTQEQSGSSGGMFLTMEEFKKMQTLMGIKAGGDKKNPGPEGRTNANPAVTGRDLRDIEARRGRTGAPEKPKSAPGTGTGPVPGTSPVGPTPNGAKAGEDTGGGTDGSEGGDSGNTGSGTGGSTGRVINRPGQAPAPTAPTKTDQINPNDKVNTGKVNTSKINSAKKK